MNIRKILVLSILTVALPIYISLGSDCRANKDFLIVSFYCERCVTSIKQYRAPDATSLEKNTAANNMNLTLFKIWLMYIGPWKFDITGDNLTNKFIFNIKNKYKDIANNGSLKNDPLGILDWFKKGDMRVADRLPNGTIENFDAEKITTKEDYTKLVSAYHDWLKMAQ